MPLFVQDVGIHKDGTTTTTAIIPFQYGAQLDASLQNSFLQGGGSLEVLDSNTNITFTTGDQYLGYKDGGGTQAWLYLFDQATSGFHVLATGKCDIDVNFVNNMRFTDSDSTFQLKTTFVDTVTCQSDVTCDTTIQVAGLGTIQQGTSGNYSKIGGAISGGYNVTSANNSGTGETDLHSYTITANALKTDGMSVEAFFAGTTANTANNKTLRVYYGGTLIGTTTTTGDQNGQWRVEAKVVRSGASAQKCSVFIISSGKWASVVSYTAVAVSNASNQTFKITGQSGTTSNDITAQVSKVWWSSV